MIEDQQRSLRREHGDAQVGIFRNTLSPDPGGVNHHPGVQSAGLVKLAVVYLDAADAIAPAQQACYFAAGKDLRAVFAGVEHIGRGEAKRVDGTVRDLHRAQQRRVDGGLPAQRFLRRERRGLYASLLTGVDKGLLPCQVIFRQGDKQPIGRFNTVAGDAAQDAVLTDAFAGGFVVGHRVAGAAVQQSMIPAGRPGGDIMALNEQRS